MCKKVYFGQLLDFSILLLLFSFSLYNYVPYFTLWMQDFSIPSIRVSNSLDPDQALHFVCLDLVQTVCKGYQQITKVALAVKRF